MPKKDRKYYFFIAVILLLIILVEANKKQPIDWRFTLQQKDKIPYGTRVLYKTIQDIFPEKKITTNKKSIWEYSQKDDKKIKNYIYISENFGADKLETQTLLNLAEEGNTIFIAAHYFGIPFKDTLNLSLQYSSVFDSISRLNFYNRKLRRTNPYLYKKSASFRSFTGFDTINTEVLAFDDENNPVFIRQEFGNGRIYLCSVPEVFTNYAMVTEKNYEFAYKALSYLPVRNVVWDEYYKPFRKLEKTSLSYFLSDKSLKIAWYIMLLTTLFFAVFTAKRKQRIIPILKPYENKTLDFVKTISGLYFKSKNHKDIAVKRFIYLNNFLKTKYNVNLAENEQLELKQTALKTGINIDSLKSLVSTYSKIKRLESISEQQLINFNKIIEDIYNNSRK